MLEETDSDWTAVHSNTKNVQVGLEEAGKSAETVGGRQLDTSLILQGGGSGGPVIQVRVVGALIRNDAGDGGIPSGVLK